MRRLIAFPCEGATLVGTLDIATDATDATGLLIVSGGNEIRAGAHRGMAMLAARIAAAGHPVFRYDRRGTGDSGGENSGYAGGGPDLRAAVAAFRAAMPNVNRLVALGNCDAATLLMLNAAEAGVDALVLTNPWTGDDADGLPPAAAIRTHYRQRLVSPVIWLRVLRGKVDFASLVRGLAKLAHKRPKGLSALLAAALAAFPGPATLVLAEGDATARGFAACWRGKAFALLRQRCRLVTIDSASHSFQHPSDAHALEEVLLEALR